MIGFGEIKKARGGNRRNSKTTFPNVAARRERAKVRAAEAAKRTPEEQLKRLDAAFGVGQGAKKERAKIDRKAAKGLFRAPPEDFGRAATKGAIAELKSGKGSKAATVKGLMKDLNSKGA